MKSFEPTQLKSPISKHFALRSMDIENHRVVTDDGNLERIDTLLHSEGLKYILGLYACYLGISIYILAKKKINFA